MRRGRPYFATLGIALIVPTHALAGMVLRSAPVFSAPAFHYSAPIFRTPVPVFRPYYLPNRAFHFTPSYSRPSILSRTNSFGSGQSWIPSHPRFGSEFATPQITRPSPIESAKSAENDLLSKLHVQTLPALSASERTVAATRAEDQLLSQLHVTPSQSAALTKAPEQQLAAASSAETALLGKLLPPSASQSQPKVTTVNATEETLLKSLEGPSATTSESHTLTISAPNENALPTTNGPAATPQQSSTVVTIINPDGTHVINPNAPSVVTTIVSGNKVDTTTSLSPNASASTPNPTYTFATTPFGGVQVSENGKPFGITTPTLAQLQYGYKPSSQLPATSALSQSGNGLQTVASNAPNQPQPASQSSALANETPILGSSTLTNVSSSSTSQSAANALDELVQKNNQFLQSTPGQLLTGAGAAVGGAYAEQTLGGWTQTLGAAGTLSSAAAAWKTGSPYLAGEQIVNWGTTKAGSMVGAALMPEDPVLGSAIGGATTTTVLNLSDKYVGSWGGSIMYNLDPSFFSAN